MKEKRKCLVGYDSDSDGGGCLGGFIAVIGAILIVIAVILTIIVTMVFLGAFIGGFHAIKNYVIAFKHNIFDSNFRAVSDH